MNRKVWAILLVVILVPSVLGWIWATKLDTPMHRRIVHREIQSIIQKAKLHPDDATFCHELLRRAQSVYSFEASTAASALGRIGDAAIPVMKDIAKLMRSKNPYVRSEAAIALSNLGPRSAVVLDELVEQVKKVPSDEVSWFAAEALGEIGAPAVKYAPLLESLRGTGAVQFDDCLNQSLKKLKKIKNQ